MIHFCHTFCFPIWYSYANIGLFSIEKFVVMFCFRKYLSLVRSIHVKLMHCWHKCPVFDQLNDHSSYKWPALVFWTHQDYISSQNENCESINWKKNYHFWRKIAEIACFLAFTWRFDPKVLHLLRLHACLGCNFSYASFKN